MPVSTRSHILNDEDPQNGSIRSEEKEKINTDSTPYAMRNLHHGLKEKLKSLTLLYEQQKQASMATKTQSFDPIHENCSSETQQKEPIPNGSIKKEEKFPILRKNSIPNSPNPPPDDDEAKENLITGPRLSCPPRKATSTTTVARKLSLGLHPNPNQVTEKGQEMMGGPFEGQKSHSSRILVFVRLRPMMKREKEGGCRSCVRIVNRREVYLTENAVSEHDYLRLKRLRGRHFMFDAAFAESATQLDVYSTTTADVVEAVLQGKNGTVFCYGATGAGKTYTMLGTVENPGVMVLAIKDLFTKIRQKSFDGNHVVHLSYLEVYNETVRDLLSPGRPLVLREDKQGIVASGLTQYRAYSTDEVMALLLQGNKNRTTEPTRANETSSRSHAILQVIVEYRTRDGSMNVMNRVGKLSLIDLAGSERALATDQRTARSIEGANINRSLLALSSCINALVEGKKHIPYRNSKLTQLLKDSLGGACNTVMIANISPSNFSFGETQNTLHWADRAKEIHNKACETNEELVVQGQDSDAEQAKLLLKVQKENRELRVQLARQQQKLLTLEAQSLAANSTPNPPSSNKANEKRKPKTTSLLLNGNCFTPEPKKKGAEKTVRELQQVVKALEDEIERMKKNHAKQLKQKDDKIKQLMQNGGGEGLKMVVTRASLRPKEASNNGELRTPGHRFQSPAPSAKKRTFWDITTANSPSVITINGRKTRSHVVTAELAVHAPSMLLQPGFARQRLSPMKL